MGNFSYGLIFLVIFVTGGYLFYVYKQLGEKAAIVQAKELAYKLMLFAEKRLELGEEKFDWVVKRFYDLLPDTAKILFREEDIELFLQKTYDELKDILEGEDKNSV